MHARVLGPGATASVACTPPQCCLARSCDRPYPSATCRPSCSMGGLRRPRCLPFCAAQHSRPRHARQQMSVRCDASEDDSHSTAPVSDGDRIKRTLTGLDALLGIDPEEELRKKKKEDDEEARKSEAKRQSDAAARSISSVDVTIDSDVLEKLRKADEEREGSKRGEDSKDGDRGFDPQIAKIVEIGKKLADKQKDDKSSPEDEEKLTKELEKLIRPADFPRADLEVLKKEVFSQDAFRVTETTQLVDVALAQGSLLVVNGNVPGIYVAGTLRMPREKLFDTMYDRLRAQFGDKYELFMVTDTLAEGDDPRGGPRIAFQVMEAEGCRPKSATNWQLLFSVGLAVLTAGSCFQLGAVSNLSMLPKETLDFINSNTAGIDPSTPVPGLEGWDPQPWLEKIFPISLSVFGIQSLHELSHRVMAALRKVKLGASFFIPNGQLGTFGAVTPFKSMVKKRADLFDVAVAGPVAAGAAAAGLFLVGLAFSAGGGQDCVPVPTALFQGSLALGSLVQSVLGEKALAGASVPIHPFLIAGWAGMVTTALNLLPVGSIDGGRIAQGAFGQQALKLTSFVTYVGLGLGFLGSGLALPFGLYVLIVQRTPEPVLLDSVTPPSSSRQVLAAALIFAAVLVLLPMAPNVAEDISGIGGPSMFL